MCSNLTVPSPPQARRVHCLGWVSAHHSSASSIEFSLRLTTWPGLRWRLKAARMAAQSLLPLLLLPTTMRGRDPISASRPGVSPELGSGGGVTWLMTFLRREDTVLPCLVTTRSGGTMRARC